MAADDFFVGINWKVDIYPPVSETKIREVFNVSAGGGIMKVLMYPKKAFVLYQNPARGRLAVTKFLANNKFLRRLFKEDKVLATAPTAPPPSPRFCDHCDIQGHTITKCLQLRQPVLYLFDREIQGRERLQKRESFALLQLRSSVVL